MEYWSKKCLKQKFHTKMKYTYILLVNLSVFDIVKQKGMGMQSCYAVCRIVMLYALS